MNKICVQFLWMWMASIQLQGQELVTITIDSNCFELSDTSRLDGTFGLYGGMKIPEYPFWVDDTLLKELAYQTEQSLTLEPMQYTLRYIPNDTTQKTHQRYFYPSNKQVYLNCFFFNKAYLLRIKTMANNDFIVFSSRYCGPTNMETMIPIYTLTILKKHGSFYVSYSESKVNEQGFLLIEKMPDLPYHKTDIKLTKEYRKLTEQEIEVLLKFEDKMSALALDYYTGNESIPANNNILTKNGYTSFFSQGYLSKLLWDELNQHMVKGDK